MEFIIHNWLWFGAAALVVFVFALINFLATARASMSGSVSGFKRGIGFHLTFMVLWIATLVPFFIGAVVAIIKYVQNH
jgi:hypothetical protein